MVCRQYVLFIVMSSALLLAMMAVGQAPQDERVTLSIGAAPASKIVEALATQTGRKLTVAPGIDQDVLVVAVTDAPVQGLLDRIAQATTSRWVQQDDGSQKLTPDTSAREKEAREVIDRKTAELREELQRAGQGGQQMEFPPEMAAQMSAEQQQQIQMRMQERNRSQQLVASIVGACDLRVVAGLLEGQRVVFSTNATRMQRPFTMPGNALQQWVQSHNQRIQNMPQPGAGGRAGAPPPNGGGGRGGGEFAVEFAEAPMPAQGQQRAGGQRGGGQGAREAGPAQGQPRGPQPITQPPAKILVAFSKGGFGPGGGFRIGVEDMINVNVTAYDAQGRQVLQEDMQLGTGAMERMFGRRGGPQRPGATAQAAPSASQSDNSAGILLSDDAKWIAQQFSGSGMQGMVRGMMGGMMAGGPLGMAGGGQQQDTAATIARLMKLMGKPGETDPLARPFGEAALGWAKQENLDLVAVLPDSIVDQASQFTQGFTVNRAKEIFGSGGMKMKQEGEWVVATPSDPVESRRDRLYRGDLQLLVQYANDNPLTLADRAEYAAKNPLANRSPLMGLYGRLGASQLSPIGTNWNMLRFYGSLNQTQQSAAKNGTSMSFNGLTVAAKSVLAEMVYGAGANLEAGQAQANQSPQQTFQMMGGGFMGGMGGRFGGPGSLLTEPTESLPNGLPTDGSITLNVRKLSVFRPVSAEGRPVGFTGNANADELTMQQTMMQLMPAEVQGMVNLPSLDRFQIGKRTEMRFTFNLRSDLRTRGALNDDAFTDKKIYTADTLPSDVKAELTASRQRAEAMAQQMRQRMGQGGGRSSTRARPPQ